MRKFFTTKVQSAQRARSFALVFFVPLWLLFSPAAHSDGVTLDGQLTQGGLVVGRALPGATASLDGIPVTVSPDGVFLLGFARDAKPESRLIVRMPQGTTEARVLKIARREFPVQRIDGLPQRQVTPSPEDQARIKADNAAIAHARAQVTPAPLFLSGFQWPVSGPISGVFGSQRILNGEPKSPHNGVDIAAPAGTLVTAPADGVAAIAHDDMFYTGKTLMIDHGFGLLTVYAHLSAIEATPGQRIVKGQPIGRVGATGRVTAAHLHWGLSLGTLHLDPALVAGPMGNGN